MTLYKTNDNIKNKQKKLIYSVFVFNKLLIK